MKTITVKIDCNDINCGNCNLIDAEGYDLCCAFDDHLEKESNESPFYKRLALCLQAEANWMTLEESIRKRLEEQEDFLNRAGYLRDSHGVLRADAVCTVLRNILRENGLKVEWTKKQKINGELKRIIDKNEFVKLDL